MRVLESDRGVRRGQLLVVVANAIPIAGLFVFDWEPYQALFVYWVEIGIVLLGYTAIVLFGQRPSKPDEKAGASFPGRVSLPVPDGSIRPIRSLPPIRYENLQYVPVAPFLVLFFWFFLSRGFLDFSNPGVVLEGARPDLGSTERYFLPAYSREGLALAAVTASIHLYSLGRDYLCRRLVDEYSAAMLLELPFRIVFLWLGLVLLLAPVYFVLGAADVAPAYVSWGFLLALLGLKLVVDRALVRLRYDPDPDVVTRLFVPNERKNGDG